MIRIAEIKDSSDIAALSIQVWLDTYAKKGIRKSISQYVLNEFTEKNIQSKLTSKNDVYFVAIEKGHLIGYVSLKLSAKCPITANTIPELDKLYIQENFTANGVGSVLLQQALSFCNSIGHEQVWLTVFHENTRALKFYEKHGFQEVGVTYFELDNEKHKNHVLCKSTAA
ncbi:acetyltransferase (GNAT) family protein [Sinobacterium caligoides]|uniref:Acetyltransferase (GNAT) family protein n=1 Tax=Sinobacterium caligoides TaxID=933926 RepID=A0A3N2DDL4_9GAMM|nr:GNAT family N-acetyltransferase [Sinobacterium caligoides]ROR97890.1 acetyltransferase (GNAT) family protein [Sinobacterium caligoides]